MPEVAMDTIDDDLLGEIARLGEIGSEMYDEGDDGGAIACWRRAIGLLPEPREQWPAWASLHAAIGEALEGLGDARGAEAEFRAALASADGLMLPLVPYMVGVLTLERGDEAGALDHLMHAYALSGRELFVGERGARAWTALSTRREPAGV